MPIALSRPGEGVFPSPLVLDSSAPSPAAVPSRPEIGRCREFFRPALLTLEYRLSIIPSSLPLTPSDGSSGAMEASDAWKGVVHDDHGRSVSSRGSGGGAGVDRSPGRDPLDAQAGAGPGVARGASGVEPGFHGAGAPADPELPVGGGGGAFRLVRLRAGLLGGAAGAAEGDRRHGPHLPGLAGRAVSGPPHRKRAHPRRPRGLRGAPFRKEKQHAYAHSKSGRLPGLGRGPRGLHREREPGSGG